MANGIDSLQTQVDRAQTVLHELKLRYFMFRAFYDEFMRRTRGRRISIKNEHVWRLTFDMRDALAIHFASWAKAMTAPGGLFGHLKASQKQLYVSKPKRGQSPERRKVFQRLLPGAARTNTVQARDVDALAKRFERIVAPVRGDRNATLAHMYERNADLSRRLVMPVDYGRIFRKLERLMNDLSIVLKDTTRSYGDGGRTSTDQVAQDLVDMVLCGTIPKVLHEFGVLSFRSREGGYYWQYRQDFYSKRRAPASRREQDDAG